MPADRAPCLSFTSLPLSSALVLWLTGCGAGLAVILSEAKDLGLQTTREIPRFALK